MGLKLIKQGDGIRPTWYAKYKDGNSWKTINLRVKVHGKPPKSLNLKDPDDLGDGAFQRSKATAENKLNEFIDQLKKHMEGGPTPTLLKELEAKKSAKHTLAALSDIEELRLRQLYKDETDSREKRLLKEKINLRRRVYNGFATFMTERYPKVSTLSKLSTAIIDDYFGYLSAQYSKSVTGKHLHLIKSAWERYTPTGTKSPFGDVPELLRKFAKSNPSIPRRPLTASDVAALWKTAKAHDATYDTPLKLHPLAVTASCTGMRIGDCCNLKWSNVHLDAKPNPLITVTTAKTGQTVTLPIFKELLAVLSELDTHRDCRDEFVFPTAHARYEKDADAIFKKGKRLFARTLFADAPEEIAEKPSHSPQATIAIIRAVPCDHNRTAEWKERVIDIYTRHIVKGESYGMISKSLGISKGQVSSYIATVERLTGDRIRNGGNTVGGMTSLIEKTKAAHAKSGRKSSIYGWHSLRASFVVFALGKGIPKEIVAKIVGHSTVETTLRYFNPTEKNAADIFANYMGESLLSQNAPQALVNAPGLLPAPDATNASPATPDAPQNAPAANLDALKAQLASLPPEQRQSILATLK